MEAVIKDYLSRELVQDATILPFGNETALFESVDLVPENFDSADAISSYLRYRVRGRADQAGARG